MKRPPSSSAFDLVEHAVHLLRKSPVSTLFCYYVGTIPFVLALLYFFAEMSHNPFAERSCAAGALGLAGLFFWMRCWHSLYCQKLVTAVIGEEREAFRLRHFFKVFWFHLVHSSSGLILVPLSLLLSIPFAWVFSYFNTLCVVGAEGGRSATGQARKVSMSWPKQNHVVLSILSVLALFVFINLFSALIYLPNLLKSLFGLETEFTQVWYWFANATFLSLLVSLVYLVMDPLVKAVYVLRYAECVSVGTGDDLLSELAMIKPKKRAVSLGGMAVLLVMLSLWSAPFVGAQDQVDSVDVEQLDQAVDQLMTQSELSWRMPRDTSESELGYVDGFMASIGAYFDGILTRISESLERFFEKMFDPPVHTPKGEMNPAVLKGVCLTIAVIFICLLAFILFRSRRKLPAITLPESEAVERIDLEDDEVIATLLEEEEWIELAHELRAAGEVRKAARAWFLAGLALLVRHEMLSVIASKTNLDYRRELALRARRCPALIPPFSDNIALFERAWYGIHSISMETLEALEENIKRMRDGFEK